MDGGFTGAWFVKAALDWVRRGKSDTKAADIGVADQATFLDRQLRASFFADWPEGPQNQEQRAQWAVKIARGFHVTDATLAAMVEARRSASDRVSRAANDARKEYQAMGDLLTPLVPRVINPDIKRFWELPEVVAVDAQLRKAWAHMRPCRDALKKAGASRN
jgi:hypothetical protein